MSLDEIIRQARDDHDDVVTLKRTPNKAFRPLVPKGQGHVHKGQGDAKPNRLMLKPAVPVVGKSYKRKMRCRQCEACRRPDCGTCLFCL